MIDFFLIGFIVAFMYVIYDTDALPFYLKFINNKVFRVSEYFEHQKTTPIRVSYLEYFTAKSNSAGKYNFLLNLLVCPNCTAVWLCFLSSFIYDSYWKNLGVKIIVVWIGYALLRKILKELYE